MNYANADWAVHERLNVYIVVKFKSVDLICLAKRDEAYSLYNQ